MFNAGVEVFDILAHDDEINTRARVPGDDAGKFAYRADVGVGLEQFAQGDVRGLLAVADRGTQRSFKQNAGAVD